MSQLPRLSRREEVVSGVKSWALMGPVGKWDGCKHGERFFLDVDEQGVRADARSVVSSGPFM